MPLSRESAIDLMRQQVQESCAVKRNFSSELVSAIWDLAKRTASAYQKGQKMLIMGNGGSAADAQHIAAELVGKFRLQRRALAALALTTNTSILTAVSNDFGFDQSFVRQVEALASPGDIVKAISTSGRSANVLRAVESARSRKCFTAALTGRTGGELSGKVDLLLAVPSEDTQRIQEAHGLIGHLYCDLVERILLESS